MPQHQPSCATDRRSAGFADGGVRLGLGHSEDLAAGTPMLNSEVTGGSHGPSRDSPVRWIRGRMAARFVAYAFDYDGTLTDDDHPSREVLAALRDCRAAGSRIVLVTGRILAELRQVFPEVDEEFDAIVAENGAVLLDADGARDLAPAVDPDLAHALAHREVPFRTGRVVLACDACYAATALEEVGRLGLDCQLVRNRGALMVVPSGVTKGTGLVEALGELGVSRHSTLAVGDAENDLQLLEVCELGVAVANAVESVKLHADVVLERANGAGIVELLHGPLVTGAARISSGRWQVTLGHTADGNPVTIPASAHDLLVTGASGAGKSFLTGLIAEQLAHLRYGVLVVDREGDHVVLGSRRGVVVVGGPEGLPPAQEVVALFAHRFGSVIVDLSLLDPTAQDRYVAELLPLVRELQLACGSPHWVVLDEAHTTPDQRERVAAGQFAGGGYVFATHLPTQLPARALAEIDAALVLPGDGEGAREVRSAVAQLYGGSPDIPGLLSGLARGQAVLVRRDVSTPLVFDLGERHSRHVRHWHKYTDAQLPAHLRFAVGTDGAEGIAGNVREFHRALRRAAPETLAAHASRRDLSRWIADVLQEPGLAALIAELEQALDRGHRPVEETRAELLVAIERHYLT
jgi:hydroxymethylpyrimidine pyrophosphatase-like HAD family hydrolase